MVRGREHNCQQEQSQLLVLVLPCVCFGHNSCTALCETDNLLWHAVQYVVTPCAGSAAARVLFQIPPG